MEQTQTEWIIEINSEIYDEDGNPTGIVDWHDLGEGPFSTWKIAHQYGEAEVGVPWRVALKENN